MGRRGPKGTLFLNGNLDGDTQKKRRKKFRLTADVFDAEHQPSLLKGDKVFMIRDEWQPSTDVINMQILGANAYKHADTLLLTQIK